MEKDYKFIERTQQIIRQYDKFQLPAKEFYDITLLLNCCVGLLFVAKEKGKNAFIDKNKRPLNEWHIDENAIGILKKAKDNKLEDEPKTLFNVCRHLRNSIAHCYFQTVSKNGVIDELVFRDFLPNKPTVFVNQTFEYTTSVNSFREFLQLLSNEAVVNNL